MPLPKPPMSLTLRVPSRVRLPLTLTSGLPLLETGAPSPMSKFELALNTSEFTDKVLPVTLARWPPSATIAAPLSKPLPVKMAPLLISILVLSSEPLIFNVPALTVVLPVRVLIPERVSVPVPSLFNSPVPVSTPSKMLLALLPPILSVLLLPISVVPLPVRLATLPEPPRLRLVAAPRLTTALLPSAAPLSVVRLPACTSKMPLKVLLPLSVTSARPFLVNVPAPAITPPRVRLLLPARARLALTLTALASTSGEVLSRVELSAGQRTGEVQRTAVDVGVAGEAVDPGQVQRPGTDFGQAAAATEVAVEGAGVAVEIEIRTSADVGA